MRYIHKSTGIVIFDEQAVARCLLLVVQTFCPSVHHTVPVGSNKTFTKTGRKNKRKQKTNQRSEVRTSMHHV